MHLFLLVIWMAIATILRLTNLTLKPLWTDEFSTLVFSQGNSFLTIPLDRAISLAELLQPLQPAPHANLTAVLTHLFTESNHPPLYFVLSHFWLQHFPTVNGWVSGGAARALSALFGVLAVPFTYYLGWVAFRSRLSSHLAALLMALSPFGIYLAQEARHYTLAILWILGSLICLVQTAQRLSDRQRLPLWLGLTWVGINGLGIATHYFFLLTLLTQAIVLGALLWLPASGLTASRPISAANQQWLGAVVLGTLATGLMWVPMLLSVRGTELTRWLNRGEFDASTWIDPLLRLVAGLVSMVYLLPIQGVPTAIALLSGVSVGVMTVATGWWGWQGWNSDRQTQPQTRLSFQVLGGYIAGAIALSLVLTYGFGINFASVFRYQFFYFPAIIVVLGAGLCSLWKQRVMVLPRPKAWLLKGQWVIILVCLLSLLGGLSVISNLGYAKTHRPDRVARDIHQSSQAPTLVAIPYKTHGQTGRLMGIAWSLWQQNPMQANQTQFLLNQVKVDHEPQAIAPLQQTLQHLPRPLNVWRVNYRSELNPLSHTALTQAGCTPTSKLRSVDGYRYQPYTCP
jgi:uncharacterized membrane protein